jgi:predicted nucleic acid-binding protein
MRWFFDGGSHDYADAVLDRLSVSNDQAIVPLLWFYEVSAVLSRAVTKNGIDARKVSDFFDDLEALPITLDDESTRRVLTDVHRLAVMYRLTSYDAAYLETALRRALPLATLDAELIAAARTAGVVIIS